MLRLLTFTLASLSFAALLGQFYGLWQMQSFALWAMLPGTLGLIALWARYRAQPRTLSNPATGRR
ncbi:hypothetical protein DYH09_26515 [bacterium CPR1]|nr:hypothetical protein [bacterium CPR1]